jgi:hypothetical protein
MSVLTVILAIAVFVLIILCVYFIYTSVTTSNKFINPSKCPKQTTEFGVTPLTLGNKILSQCGTDKSQVCTFSNIGNLSEAIDLCHQYANICTSFSYAAGVLATTTASKQGIMNIISATDGLSSSTIYDTYTQQVFSVLTTK